MRVGYVVDNPIWKTSYRLVLDTKNKPFLQGWAVVENPSDEDWKDVRMTLVSGRPISFQMDLYQPLYVPRPVVEPELFASLRPPTYTGDMGYGPKAFAMPTPPPGVPMPMAPPGASMDFGGYGGGGYGGGGYPGASSSPSTGISFGPPGTPVGPPGGPGTQSAPATPQDQQRFQFFYLVPSNQQAGPGAAPPAPQPTLPPGAPWQSPPEGRMDGRFERSPLPLVVENKPPTGELDLRKGTVAAAAAKQLGDFFQYAIDQPVSLPRQKSAMLPIVNKEIEAGRVSIYNEKTLATHPLLGLRFKNTTGLHLMQGPITIFEGSSYAGDAQVLDLQPNEERLISYAIDLGTEVDPVAKQEPDRLMSVKIDKGTMIATNKVRETKTYTAKNRSEQERTLVIEHPVRPDYKLVNTDKPAEQTRNVYRFDVKVPAGKTVTQTVIEERQQATRTALTNSPDDTVRISWPAM